MEKKTHEEKMTALIEKLCELGATVEGRRVENAFGGMVQFAWGQRLGGTIMKSEVPGIYTMLSVAQDPETKQLRPWQVFFAADTVTAIMKEPETSPIVQATPGNMQSFLNS